MGEPRKVKVCSPVEPYELDKKMRFGMESIVSRVVNMSAAKGLGHDLLLRIYMAGIYHGVELSKRIEEGEVK